MIKFLIQGNFLLFLFFGIVFSGLMIRYWQHIQQRRFLLRVTLLASRAATILVILYLILDLLVHWWGTEEQLPEVAVMVDHSQSMELQGLTADQLSRDIEQLKDRLEPQSASVDFLAFGEEVREMDGYLPDFSDSHTSLADAAEYLRDNPYQHVFWLTDGIATRGTDFTSMAVFPDTRYHFLTVGGETQRQDLRVESVQHPGTAVQGDTIQISASLGYDLTESLAARLQVRSGENTLHTENLKFAAGEGFRTIEISLAANELAGTVSVELIPTHSDSNPDNDRYQFHLNLMSQDEQVVLISGTLSPNTAFIHEMLRELPRAESRHYYRTDLFTWNQSPDQIFDIEARLIVLDNFPATAEDRRLLNELVQYCQNLRRPLFYFDGPQTGANVLSDLANQLGCRIQPNQIPEAALTLETLAAPRGFIDLTPLEQLPPQRRNLIWVGESTNILVAYSDGSAAMVRNERTIPVVGIFLPELAKTQLKIQTTDYAHILSNALEQLLLREFLDEGQVVQLTTEKGEYDLGDPVLVSARIHDAVTNTPRAVRLTMTNAETGSEEILAMSWDPVSGDYRTDVLPPGTGSWHLTPEVTWNSGTTEMGADYPLVVQQVRIEVRNLTPDLQGMSLTAQRSKGSIQSLNDLPDYLASIRLSPVKKAYDHHFAALDLQPWWWILILLLAVEWFIRKRVGLL